MSSHDSGSPEGSELFLLRQQTNKLRLRIGELKKRLVERESLLALADEAFLVHLRELDHTKRDLIAYKNAADVILKSGLLRGESRTSSEAQTADELEHLLMSLEEQEHYSRDRPSEARAMMYVYRSADQVD